MADKKLVYANSDVTVHVAQGKVDSQFGNFEVVEGRNLAVGDTVELDSLPAYQREAIEAGEVEGLEVVSESEAEKRAEQLDKVKALLSGAPGQVDVVHDAAPYLLGDDNSHSDHVVPDEVKRENLAAQAEAESGSGSSKKAASSNKSDDDK